MACSAFMISMVRSCDVRNLGYILGVYTVFSKKLLTLSLLRNNAAHDILNWVQLFKASLA